VRLYTRTGDAGQTDVRRGHRGAKDSPRLEVSGTLDELGSLLGLVRAETIPGELDAVLDRLQRELFDLGSLLMASPSQSAGQRIDETHVQRAEVDIDHFDAELAPLDGFILPGGTRAAAGLHVARAVCRRAERRLVALAREPDAGVPAAALAYLNRLGDLLFVLARTANQRAQRSDVPWRRRE